MHKAYFGQLICLFLLCQGVYALGLTGQQSENKPVLRYGSLPFPSVMYTTAQADLGEHSYEGKNTKTGIGFASLFSLNVGDVDRGIAYTCRLGFIDIAHVRNGIDYTAYFYAKIKAAMLDRRQFIELKGLEPSIYKVTFNYPERWQDLSPTELTEEIDRIALLGGQYLTHISMTWHEILTWYGWTVGAIPNAEKSSAFTYDDIISHLLGTEIAARAILNPALSFNEAVTLELNRELDIKDGRLKRLSAHRTRKLGNSLKGNWYKPIIPHFVYNVKRFTDIGLEKQNLQGVLIPNLDDCKGAKPVSVIVPGMREFGHGGIYDGLIDVDIDPAVRQKNRILQGLKITTVNVRNDLGKVMEIMEKNMSEEFGEDVFINVERKSP